MDYALDVNFVAINRKQWDMAVAPVLKRPEFDMSSPLNRSLLSTGRVDQILSALGFALEAQFVQAGYGPAASQLPVFPAPSPVPFVPRSLSGLLGWFDASDSSTVTLEGGGPGVRRWENKGTATSFNASQQTVADQPEVVTAALNGLDVLRFDGISDHFTLPLSEVFDFTLFVVGRYNPGSDIGTWFAATGFEGSFGGPDCRIYQTSAVGPQGTALTSRNNLDLSSTANSLAVGVYGLVEYAGLIVPSGGRLEVGVEGHRSIVFNGDTSDDYWDDSRQLFGESPPILASLGRRNAGLNALAAFNYLDGDIAEILLYTSVLSEDARSDVRNYLRSKWGLP